LEHTPLPELLKELERRDPVTFKKIDRQNPRRIFRAIEVIRLTGKPFSEQRAEWKHGDRITASTVNPEPPAFFGLTRLGEDLRARIDIRVNGMFERGLHQASRINRCDTRADDGNEIVAKNVERTSQCVCLGSDQAERPVTTSNCFRSELTN